LWFIPGSFLGFLGILRIPEDSTRNWWGRVKTSLGLPKDSWEWTGMEGINQESTRTPGMDQESTRNGGGV
jgi:hypothetical protein